jgi:hypothetical protein
VKQLVVLLEYTGRSGAQRILSYAADIHPRKKLRRLIGIFAVVRRVPIDWGLRPQTPFSFYRHLGILPMNTILCLCGLLWLLAVDLPHSIDCKSVRPYAEFLLLPMTTSGSHDSFAKLQTTKYHSFGHVSG